jgi:hypothetical protein
MLLPNPFPVARYRLHARVLRPLHWPEYQGSALRGLWGHALRQMVCATGRNTCADCPLLARCSYPALFEPAPPAGARSYGDMTPPYVIEPIAGPRRLVEGAHYAFDLVLFGRGLTELPLVLRAWQRALAGHIGPAGGALVLQRVEWMDAECGALEVARADSAGLGAVAQHQPGVSLPQPHEAPPRIRVEFLTPLYVKHGGRPLAPDQLGAAHWLWALVRRVAEICELHLGQPTGLDFQALKGAAQSLRFHAAQFAGKHHDRWSNRQQRHTPLHGVVGQAEIDGPLDPFWPLLHLCQWLHAGGKTSFGLGRYRIEPA